MASSREYASSLRASTEETVYGSDASFHDEKFREGTAGKLEDELDMDNSLNGQDHPVTVYHSMVDISMAPSPRRFLPLHEFMVRP
jgi:hypothetical protein